MNHSQLRAFHLVAREGSFTRAARAAGIGQPALSSQVRAMELTYNVRLFDRHGRGAQLTEFGRRLYALTDRMFALENTTRMLLAGAKAESAMHLKISADNIFHVLPIMKELRHRQPGVRFSLRIGNSEAVLREIADYEADVGVTAKRPQAPRFHAISYFRDRLALFVPRDHEWAHRSAVSLAELAGRDMVLREPGSVTREEFERARRAARIELGNVMDVQSREAVREVVAAGFGIGVVFQREFTSDPRLALLSLRGQASALREYIVCLAERRRMPAVQVFLQIAAGLADRKP
ncbi:MAG TPA: LysR substrate-binding domain-containing protein [Alphaproteobacteria bacterium]|nr:LysR substrate-binding domain-containing protein [Alphaproteobacteria bacterium]